MTCTPEILLSAMFSRSIVVDRSFVMLFTICSTDMKAMKVVSFSEARSNLKTVLDQVVKNAD